MQRTPTTYSICFLFIWYVHSEEVACRHPFEHSWEKPLYRAIACDGSIPPILRLWHSIECDCWLDPHPRSANQSIRLQPHHPSRPIQIDRSKSTDTVCNCGSVVDQIRGWGTLKMPRSTIPAPLALLLVSLLLLFWAMANPDVSII